MGNSTKRAPVRKPRPDFPLFPHATGRWAKKVRGRLHYFGNTEGDAKGNAALLKWLEEKDDLLAGRTPRTKSGGLTVGELCDRFLQAKDDALAAGEITKRTREDHEDVTDRIVGHFRKNRLLSDLTIED